MRYDNCVGELACVVREIFPDKKGTVRVFSKTYNACCENHVEAGEWVRILRSTTSVLRVRPLTVNISHDGGVLV